MAVVPAAGWALDLMFRPLALLLLLGSLGACLGCEMPLCAPEADEHARYRLDVIERYDDQSSFIFQGARGGSAQSTGTCAAADGIQPGAAIELQATGAYGNRVSNCGTVTADLVVAPPPTLILGSAGNQTSALQARGDAFMSAAEQVSFGGCAGTLLIDVFVGGATGGIYATPVAGEWPPAVLYRLFSPAAGSTCQLCDDNFVIQLAKL